MIQAAGTLPSVKVIGDALAEDNAGPPLKVRTIQAALKDLREEHLLDLEADSESEDEKWF